MISPSEIQYADSFSYLGSPIPTRALALRNEISLGSRLLLTVRFEHLGGHKRANAVEAGRCGGRSCADAIVPSTPLGRQARAAFKLVKFDESTAYLEDGSFTKLREVSLSVDAPRAWASALSGDRLRLILTGRDLLTWSSYRGLDPETNTGRGIAYSSIDEGELPRLPTYGARIDISW